MTRRATARGAQRTSLEGTRADVLICGASFAGLAVARELADLISIEDHYPGPGIGELAGYREAGEARTADKDVGVAAQRRALLAALGASRRHGEPGYFKPLSL